MIEGFPRRPSVLPGGRLELHVATDAPAFRVDVYRWGREAVHAWSSEWLEGRRAPHHLPFQDWGRANAGLHGEELEPWPAYALPVPADAPSAVYVAVLVEGDGTGEAAPPAVPPPLDARSARALFVVRSAAPGRDATVLYKVPLFTYHAYNQVSAEHWSAAARRGGWCLYSEFLDLPVPGLPAVSVLRPGGGTGATTFDTFNPDPFDPTPRQAFVHWDALAVGWLEREGQRVDVCTDLDLHEDGAELLAAYRLLLSVGHDEYWSDAMRAAVEGFVAAGGSAAFLGGNTCWWRITFDSPFAFRRAGHWHDVPGRPENLLTGVSFRNGGERPLGFGLGDPVGFRVQHADHWLYAGTGLRDGDAFGGRADEHLVGYECDGAHFDRGALGRRPVRPTGVDGTPEDFVILAVGDVGRCGWGDGNRAATLGLHAPGGTVVTAATTDWPRLLARRSPVVEQVTRNVLERLA
jgi:hypothetical protein